LVSWLVVRKGVDWVGMLEVVGILVRWKEIMVSIMGGLYLEALVIRRWAVDGRI